MTDAPDISIIIPANNEASMIDACLQSVLASNGPALAQIIVAANGCTDGTEDLARAYADQAKAKGWTLDVLSLAEGSKLAALMAQLADALAGPEPRYASGALTFTPSPSLATRLYARTYARVPYIANGLPGAGLFAVNRAGRALWDTFPRIISDDTYVRLLFTPAQRVRVEASYTWPLVDGFANLVRVRRRQNAGVAEVERLYPHLPANDDKLPVTKLQMLKLALRDPISFAVYTSVQFIVKLTPARQMSWDRGR